MRKNSKSTKNKRLLNGTAKVLRALLGPYPPVTAADRRPRRRKALQRKSSEEAIERSDQLANTLGHGTDESKTIVAGSLELVGLDDVRRALADSWPAIAERVYDVAEEELQRHLDPLDIFRRHGNAAYLIHFDSLDKQAAELKAQSIAANLRNVLAKKIPEVANAISVRHFVAGVAAIPASYRKMLAVTIGSHERVAAPVLLRCADDVRTYVPYVAIELTLNDSRLHTIAAGAPWAVSANLAGMNASNGQLAADLCDFVRATAPSGVVSMAPGANSVGLVAAAVAAQFTYIDGTAIHLPVFEPRLRRRLRSPVPAGSMAHGMRLPTG
jgi:hypothetical protein